MSLEFALKDLFHFNTQSKSYLRSGISVNIFVIVFLNLTKSLGVLSVSSPINLYTYTIIELFSQYNLFLVGMAFCLSGIVIFTLNHTLIMHRKKDISVMQAVGTYPQQLYTYYILEMLILVLITWVIGTIGGFVIFLIIFLSMETSFTTISWQPDYLITLILLGILIGITFFANGWELRKIGRTSFVKNKMGLIESKGSFKLSLKIRTFLAKRTLSFRLAFYHIGRVRIEFRQTVALIAIAGSILLTGIFGSMMVYNSTSTYIEEGEGHYIISIGENSVNSAFQLGYERFSNGNAENITDSDYINLAYNLSSFSQNCNLLLDKYGIEQWEQRLFSTTLIEEQKGFVLNYGSTNVTDTPIDIGTGNQTRIAPIQGINYGNTVMNWYYEGVLINPLGGAVIGDTLGGELFENAYLQGIAFKNQDTNMTFHYKINAVIVDPFNNGNSAYLVLSDLQKSLNRPNYTNLIVIDYTPVWEAGQYSEFIEELNRTVATELGEGFSVIDIRPILTQNENALGLFQWISFIMSGIMGIIIIFVLVNFQHRQIDEQQQDYFIMRAIGAKPAISKRKIFIEQLFVIFLGIAIAFIISLLIIEFLLMANQIFPPVWVPILITGVIFGLLIGASGILAHVLTKSVYAQGIEENIRK